MSQAGPEPARPPGDLDRDLRGALAYVARPQHLRRTLRIAFVVGLVLTAINQSAVIAGGDATAATWVRCALNFVVPFVVSNLGLLGGRPRAGAGREEPERGIA